jgi:hypothetical protein
MCYHRNPEGGPMFQVGNDSKMNDTALYPWRLSYSVVIFLNSIKEIIFVMETSFLSLRKELTA